MISPELPSLISTNNTSADVPRFGDEEISVVSGESSTDPREFGCKDTLSFFKKKILDKQKKQATQFLDDLKGLASDLLPKSTEDGKSDTHKEKRNKMKKRFSFVLGCNDETESDSITEASSHFDDSNNGEDESLARSVVEQDGHSKNLKLDGSCVGDGDIQAQPILERRPGDPTSDLQVGFPKDNCQKQDMLPFITAFQSISNIFSSKNDECEDNHRESTEVDDVDNIDPPTKEEYIALQKDLIETKLEFALIQEEFDRANAIKYRVTKERDWLRAQNSTLQFELHTAKKNLQNKS